MTTTPDYIELACTGDTTLKPGLYLTMPQGHAVLAGTTKSSVDGPTVHRRLAILDMGGVVQIAGIDVTSPDDLSRLADHLRMLSLRLAREQAHPYRPGTVEGRRRDLAAQAGEMWDRSNRPIVAGRMAYLFHPKDGHYLGYTRIESVDRTAGVVRVHPTVTIDDTVSNLSSTVVFPEDVDLVE